MASADAANQAELTRPPLMLADTEAVVRYAAVAALRTSDGITDDWVSRVARAYSADIVLAEVQPDSPVTQQEISAHFDKVPQIAKDDGFFVQAEENTWAICPVLDPFDSSPARLSSVVGLFDDPDKLIIELNIKYFVLDLRWTLDKATGIVLAEMMRKTEGLWKPDHRYTQDQLHEYIRSELRGLRGGAYYLKYVNAHVFHTAQINEIRSAKVARKN